MTGLSLLVSVPQYLMGRAETIGKVLAGMDIDIQKVSEALCIKTEFIEAATKVEGYLIFIPQENAIREILGRLHV